MTNEKTIFLVTPIGNENTEIRDHADTFWDCIVDEVVENLSDTGDIKVNRADKIAEGGKITLQIKKHLRQATVVVADLTGCNPNVLYELGFRQALELPNIMMAKHGTTLPFDVSGDRCIFYDTANPRSMKSARSEFKMRLKKDLAEERNDKTQAIRRLPLDPEDAIESMVSHLEALSERERATSASVDTLSQRLDATVGTIENLFTTVYKGSGTYLYIDGEKEAFSALVAALHRAKETIRTTRFSPFSVGDRQTAFANMIKSRVLGSASDAQIQNFSRIVAANNRSKLNDIYEYINCFVGKPFTLYLTRQSNSFELVIIDSAEVFLHFHGRDKVIASTLHIISEPVARKFIDVFSWLKDPTLHPEIEKIDFKFDKDPKELREKADRFFDKYCPAILTDHASADGNCGEC